MLFFKGQSTCHSVENNIKASIGRVGGVIVCHFIYHSSGICPAHVYILINLRQPLGSYQSQHGQDIIENPSLYRILDFLGAKLGYK